MGAKVNLVGKVFDRLTVISQSPHAKNEHTRWFCKCICGHEIITAGTSLMGGLTRSCGCIHKEVMLKAFITHGASSGGKVTREYATWRSMKARCNNPENKSYKDYGERGITICNRWSGEDGFEKFLEDMGCKPSKDHSLDRMDNEGNYEPTNCRWATRREQSINRRSNKWLEFEGRKMIIKDWGRELGTDINGIKYFLKRGKSFSEIVEYFRGKTIKA